MWRRRGALWRGLRRPRRRGSSRDPPFSVVDSRLVILWFAHIQESRESVSIFICFFYCVSPFSLLILSVAPLFFSVAGGALSRDTLPIRNNRITPVHSLAKVRVFFGLAKPSEKTREFCPRRHCHQRHHHHATMPRPRVLKRMAANCLPSPSKTRRSRRMRHHGHSCTENRIANEELASTDPAHADKPTTADPTSSEPATTDSTIF